MKRVFIAGFIISFLLLVIFISNPHQRLNTKLVSINNHLLTVETADTDEKRTQGLSNRERLGQNDGMLFIFPSPSYYRFWMKEMKFPLDFIWIKKDTIVDLTQDISPPKLPDESLPTFTSKFPFDKVIELNAGEVKSLNIKIGDRILL